MKRAAFLLSFALPLLATPASLATASPATVQQVSNAFWHHYVDERESNAVSGQPYWDGNSWDTHSVVDNAAFPRNAANIGALLEGHLANRIGGTTYGLGAAAPGSAVEFLTGDNLAAPEGFWFQRDEGAATYAITLVGELSAYEGVSEFGWYALDDPTMLHPIFSGPDGRLAHWTGILPGRFGIYYRDPVRGIVFRSQFNGLQFAPFRIGNTYLVGIEDLVGPISGGYGPDLSDYDYNDMMIRIDQVPEPATLALLGGGLVLATLAARKRGRVRR